MPACFAAENLIAFARALLVATGVEEEKAAAVAQILVEGDLLGHTTHGLALLPAYLAEIEKGSMRKAGAPRVLADFPAALTWDGLRLPGPWLVVQAIEEAIVRARQYGGATVSIRRSHHIGCLAAYLRPVAERGLLIVLSCSDPSVSSVAPFGGRTDVFTPNPLAAAWPTDGDPVIIDVSMSITTNGLTKRLHTEGRRFPGQWALDAQGEPTDDPAALYANPPGTLLPMGGTDHGHKGYALTLLVEALTGGLAGHGRADPGEGWGGNVLVQVYDPACFGGAENFRRQTTEVARACRDTPPRPGFERVRLPGESGLRRRAEQLARGVELYPGILSSIAPWAEKFGLNPPAAING
ncbi:MAG: Ldh family oxidoreductase [Opitutaceae bacterium]|nr:Ldh family oxidoreductase [Opitutaceae bacterium]